MDGFSDGISGVMRLGMRAIAVAVAAATVAVRISSWPFELTTILVPASGLLPPSRASGEIRAESRETPRSRIRFLRIYIQTRMKNSRAPDNKIRSIKSARWSELMSAREVFISSPKVIYWSEVNCKVAVCCSLPKGMIAGTQVRVMSY